jgi:sortase A
MLDLSEEIRRIDWKVFALKMLSNVLILGAIFYFLFSFWDIIRQEALYAYWKIRGQTFTVDEVKEEEPPAISPFAALLAQPTPLKVTPKSTQFGIVIEKIGVNAPVIANVSVTDKRAYLAALEKGVAHAKGTAKPGQIGNAYLFAHSSLDFWNYGPYSGVFNLLRKLSEGDRIVVFYKGERFDYYVTDKEVVSGFNTTPLTRTFDTPYLTLQTCDPPGVALNRLIITAELR